MKPERTESAKTPIQERMDAGKFRDEEYKRWCETIKPKQEKP